MNSLRRVEHDYDVSTRISATHIEAQLLNRRYRMNAPCEYFNLVRSRIQAVQMDTLFPS